MIPLSMRLDILDKLHEGNQGVTRCHERATGLSKLEELVKNCTTCAKERPNPAEPAIPSPLPDRPWQKVAADLFELNGRTYIQVVDYFSQYPEIAKLTKNHTPSADIINHLKSAFARHGIPECVATDNGPQFIAADFAKFAEQYGFTHIKSSPKYPQANGEVERAIQTTKYMLKKTKDPYLALMSYRSIPLECGLIPAELLMGRKIRTTVTISPKMLTPQWPYLDQFLVADQHIKNRQKNNFDKRHNARPTRSRSGRQSVDPRP